MSHLSWRSSSASANRHQHNASSGQAAVNIKCHWLNKKWQTYPKAELPPRNCLSLIKALTALDHKNYEAQRGRKKVKHYGVIFMCFALCGVHIEVASSLDTESFMNAMRRFIARRDHPEEMRSENRGNFVRGEREL